MSGEREIGGVIAIPGLPGMWEITGGKYNYKADACRCGVCGGLGVAWRGWFSCEDGEHVALIETGECFQRVP